MAEVKSYTDVVSAMRHGTHDAEQAQRNARAPFGVTFVRVRGGTWYAVQTLEQWATVWRETT